MKLCRLLPLCCHCVYVCFFCSLRHTFSLHLTAVREQFPLTCKNYVTAEKNDLVVRYLLRRLKFIAKRTIKTMENPTEAKNLIILYTFTNPPSMDLCVPCYLLMTLQQPEGSITSPNASEFPNYSNIRKAIFFSLRPSCPYILAINQATS